MKRISLSQTGFASSSDSAVSMPAEASSDDSRSDQGSMSPLQVALTIVIVSAITVVTFLPWCVMFISVL